MNYQKVLERLHSNDLIVLDGGTGTELQKRGVEMVPGGWCGPVSLKHRDVLEEVHLDFIQNGAEIITTNTFSSSRIMLRKAGYEDQFKEINTAAVEAALSARDRSGKKNVLIAGSLSHQIPIKPGTNFQMKEKPSLAFIQEASHELAEHLKDKGCDIIILEMMYNPERIMAILSSAKKSGLPLWAGFSIGVDEDGKPSSYDNPNCSVEEVFNCIDPDSVDVMGLMHTNATLIGTGLELLKKYWSGPLCSYPDSGFFRMPDWVFERIMPPSVFLDFSRCWFAQGARVLGGCCGLGSEHIRMLQKIET